MSSYSPYGSAVHREICNKYSDDEIPSLSDAMRIWRRLSTELSSEEVADGEWWLFAVFQRDIIADYNDRRERLTAQELELISEVEILDSKIRRFTTSVEVPLIPRGRSSEGWWQFAVPSCWEASVEQ
jgi:hypothetical protein